MFFPVANMEFCNLLYMHHQLIQMSVIDRASVEYVPMGGGGWGVRKRGREKRERGKKWSRRSRSC